MKMMTRAQVPWLNMCAMIILQPLINLFCFGWIQIPLDVLNMLSMKIPLVKTIFTNCIIPVIIGDYFLIVFSCQNLYKGEKSTMVRIRKNNCQFNIMIHTSAVLALVFGLISILKSRKIPKNSESLKEISKKIIEEMNIEGFKLPKCQSCDNNPIPIRSAHCSFCSNNPFPTPLIAQMGA